MLTDDFDSGSDDQDDLDPADLETTATDPAALAATDADDAEDDLDAAPDEDDPDAETVKLSKREHAEFLKERELVKRERDEIEFNKIVAQRNAQHAKVDSDWGKAKSNLVREIEEQGWTRERQHRLDEWDDWRVKMHVWLKNQHVADAESYAAKADIPRIVREEFGPASPFGITDKDDLRELVATAREDGLTAAKAQARVMAREAKRLKARKSGAVAKALDAGANDRARRGADRIGSGGRPNSADADPSSYDYLWQMLNPGQRPPARRR